MLKLKLRIKVPVSVDMDFRTILQEDRKFEELYQDYLYHRKGVTFSNYDKVMALDFFHKGVRYAKTEMAARKNS